MIIKILPLFLFLFVFIQSFLSQVAYPSCGSDYVHKKQLENEVYVQERNSIEATIQKRIIDKKLQKTQEETYTIPVVVHVVHLGEAVGVGSNISESQINSGIQQLTNAFRNQGGLGIDVNIEFQLAKLDPNCNPTNGIVRVDGSVVSGYSTDGVSLGGSGADEVTVKALSVWPNNLYYNIWLITEINGNDGGNGTQGFAYYPGAGSDKDGAMILNSSWGDQGTAKSWNNQGETGVHEIGHALNLYHTFEGDNDGISCPSDGCGSGLGDCCGDTPPHIRSASNCVVGTNACDGGSSTELFIHNYMDYANQTCGYLFTADQKARMRAALETQRSGLISSPVLDAAISYSKPLATSCLPLTSSNGLDSLIGGILNVKIENLNYNSGYAAQDGGYLAITDDCHSAIFSFLASTPDLSITVGINTNKVKAWIDYNNDGVLDETTEKVFDKTLSSESTGKETLVFPANVVTDVYLRLRVMNDVNNTVTGPCYDPIYGQAEDYAIIIKSAITSVNQSAKVSPKVLPNPFMDVLFVKNLPIGKTGTYQLFDITGKLIFEGLINSTELQINTATFNRGTYLLKMNSGELLFTEKILKI